MRLASADRVTARTSDFAALFRKDVPRSRLDSLIEFAPVDGTRAETVQWFVRLVAWLRPLPGQRISTKLRFLASRLRPECQPRVRAVVESLLAGTDLRRLFSHGGIPAHFHLAGAVGDWLREHILPTACDTSDGAQVLRLAFREEDIAWLGHPDVIAFARSLLGGEGDTLARIDAQLGDATVDLAHEIVAQAHAPSIRTLAQGERSPFAGLYDAVVARELAPLRGRIKQCVLFLRGHREELARRGADLNTTFQLRRLEDQLGRLDLLALLGSNASNAALGLGTKALVYSVVRSVGGRRLVSRSSDLVVQNLVDSAASVGRKYLDDEESSWGAAFKAGAGGGALMVLATIVKLTVAKLHLPTLYEGIAFSFNYASAFCAAYLLHYTIATKLPAHTAATLARCVQDGTGHRARLQAFVAIWRNTVRLQIAGLFGNVVVAGPLAFAIAKLYPLVNAEKATHILHDNSLLGPSILYATLTGIFLWLSSLLAAGADNWTRTNRLADRIATNVRALEHIGESRARSWAEAFTHRVGPLVGNAALGFMLGLVPAGFAIAQLPVEIRHVTVSTSSVAIAIASQKMTPSAIALAVAGVLAIGIVNCVVSFVLALWLALRATHGLRAAPAAYPLVRIGIRRWMR